MFATRHPFSSVFDRFHPFCVRFLFVVHPFLHPFSSDVICFSLVFSSVFHLFSFVLYPFTGAECGAAVGSRAFHGNPSSSQHQALSMPGPKNVREDDGPQGERERHILYSKYEVCHDVILEVCYVLMIYIS